MENDIESSHYNIPRFVPLFCSWNLPNFHLECSRHPSLHQPVHEHRRELLFGMWLCGLMRTGMEGDHLEEVLHGEGLLSGIGLDNRPIGRSITPQILATLGPRRAPNARMPMDPSWCRCTAQWRTPFSTVIHGSFAIQTKPFIRLDREHPEPGRTQPQLLAWPPTHSQFNRCRHRLRLVRSQRYGLR